ncbi:MAG: DUF5597 domain-containing protein [Bacteroidales bacterium]|nr:DUF5597 domain-containing protein [Bacteroidales bacterium]
MKTTKFLKTLVILSAVILTYSCIEQPDLPLPNLEKYGNVTRLIVDGNPFLVLGGELGNSSSSSREYMKEYWPKLQASGMNTVLAVVEWALVEPEEDKFDFTVVDNLIEDARNHDLRLILLWFGAWKNGQSHYMPEWVKKDYIRFPRVKAGNGKSLEILSTFGKETLKSDSEAFAAMMKHVRETDSQHRTVIMIQVQNEVGILGSPRDHNDLANTAFSSPVPQELMDYMVRNKETLLPELLEVWSATGFKPSGTWEEVFGKGVKTDEFFMAWNYACYLNECARAAKEKYPIPMFVNAWIVQPEDKGPGDYPSGGPQAHVLDFWRAGAPDIDLLCPDIYLPDFAGICAMYTRNNNALFIPESRAGEQGAGQLFYAIGKYNAIGYSPFGIERIFSAIENEPVSRAYRILSGFAPVVLEAQKNETITSVLLKQEQNSAEEVILGDYKILVELSRNWRTPTAPGAGDGYAILINSGPDEYIIYGSNIQVSFSPNTPGPAIAAIARLDEGKYENGKWIQGRRLNGDDIMLYYNLAEKALENKTGTGLRFRGDNENLQKVKLYRFE